MRYRVNLNLPKKYGTCFYMLQAPGRVPWDFSVHRTYCSHQPSSKDEQGKIVSPQDRTLLALKNVAELGRQWGKSTMRTVTATANNWWERYEEFVGLTEVRDAQSKVTEAEKAFMVARGMVREAHTSSEALQVRLKEVRDRLDRVSREDARYLELATQEHKLLQEERRLRTAYENAEAGEREKFALFSAGVRESHDKERTRAERTKNWSIIGSVLGAVIGVMGSTYVNRVRLQELKNLLLEAQKGPVSLQEAISVQHSMHKSQQEELQGLIENLRTTIKDKADVVSPVRPMPAPAPAPAPVPVPAPLPVVVTSPKPSDSDIAIKEILLSTQKAQALTESLKPPLENLEQSVAKVVSELQELKTAFDARPVEKQLIQPQDTQVLVCDTDTVIQGLGQTEKRLEAQINKSTLYNTVLTYTAFALTVPVLYIVFKGT